MRQQLTEQYLQDAAAGLSRYYASRRANHDPAVSGFYREAEADKLMPVRERHDLVEQRNGGQDNV